MDLDEYTRTTEENLIKLADSNNVQKEREDFLKKEIRKIINNKSKEKFPHITVTPRKHRKQSHGEFSFAGTAQQFKLSAN